MFKTSFQYVCMCMYVCMVDAVDGFSFIYLLILGVPRCLKQDLYSMLDQRHVCALHVPYAVPCLKNVTKVWMNIISSQVNNCLKF